ncbi:carbon-nitrogen hydrolase family protein [Dactylosporangium sp. CA-092794]|uniref:carbon-nitrogen hydrolase family protein n=1 Tax=Dactylosporangium sp. CA-092794 TaxID=3239929 RepID=UPI003D91DAF2
MIGELVQTRPDAGGLEAVLGHLEAGGAGPRLVVFPELALTGFPVDGAVPAHRVGDSEALARVEAAARRHGAHAVVGFAEENPGGRPYNSAALFGPAGLVGVVRKRHLPGREREWFSPGGAPAVFVTDLATIGVAICYDAWFPEYVKAQALAGAEIIVNINSIWAGGRDGGIGDGPVKRRYWATVPAARALDTQTYVLACNGFGTHDFGGAAGVWRRLGRSRIVDPLGRVLATAPADGPAVLRARLGAAKLDRARRGIALLTDSLDDHERNEDQA